KPKQLANLSEKNADRNAVQEAYQNWFRQKICQRPEAKEASRDAEQASEKRQRDREREIQFSVAGSEGRDCGRDHRASRCIGVHHQLARRTKNCVRDQRQDARIKADDRIESGELRVRYGNRQCDCSDRDTCNQVVPKVFGELIVQKRLNARCGARQTSNRTTFLSRENSRWYIRIGTHSAIVPKSSTLSPRTAAWPRGRKRPASCCLPIRPWMYRRAKGNEKKSPGGEPAQTTHTPPPVCK